MFIVYFWKQPDRSLATDRHEGFKKNKNHLTVMLCANADGSDKVPSWIIGESANPRCFNGVNLHRLRMQYCSNEKAWVTMILFLEWLRWFSKRLHHGRKVVLVLDNFSGH